MHLKDRGFESGPPGVRPKQIPVTALSELELFVELKVRVADLLAIAQTILFNPGRATLSRVLMDDDQLGIGRVKLFSQPR